MSGFSHSARFGDFCYVLREWTMFTPEWGSFSIISDVVGSAGCSQFGDVTGRAAVLIYIVSFLVDMWGPSLGRTFVSDISGLQDRYIYLVGHKICQVHKAAPCAFSPAKLTSRVSTDTWCRRLFGSCRPGQGRAAVLTLTSLAPSETGHAFPHLLTAHVSSFV